MRTLLILQLDVFNQIKVSWLSWPSYNYTHLCITFLWNHFLQTSLRALLFCCNMKFNGVLSCVGKILLYPVCFYNPWHSCFFFIRHIAFIPFIESIPQVMTDPVLFFIVLWYILNHTWWWWPAETHQNYFYVRFINK